MADTPQKMVHTIYVYEGQGHMFQKKLQDQKTGRGTRGVNEMGKKTCESGAAV